MYVEDRILFRRVLGAYDAAILAGADQGEATAAAVQCFQTFMPQEDSENVCQEVDVLVTAVRHHR